MRRPNVSDLTPNFRIPRTFKTLAINDGENSRWANRDVLPVPEEQITFTWKAYFGYWYVPLSVLSLPPS